ncbi:ATP-binding protein [Marivirga sp.]|uniref:AAA family ATPase n=1 Tax=Marivirga sp. TaxID=2018662 RepID=UPI002D7F0DA5|nr:ATP-binding protein [Marivirga sp.]HET8861043.1 ATP-binding protein [Marivirga sp.]
MIISFEIQNYKSIKENLTISFEAQSIRQRVNESTFSLDSNPTDKSFLKAISFYGANASGKSNIIKAISIMRDVIINSGSYQIDHEIDVEPYVLSTQTKNQPSRFELTFVINDSIYRYGFIINSQKVIEEWLYLVLKTTEKPYFVRYESGIEISNNFNEGFGRDKYVKPNSLFLSTLANLNANISTQIVGYFNLMNVITGTNYSAFTNFTAKHIENTELRGFILEIFKKGGLSEITGARVISENLNNSSLNFLSDEIKSIVKRTIRKQIKIITKHEVFDSSGSKIEDIEFDLNKESLGTQKIFALAGIIAFALKNGLPIVIDELDARLHPLLLLYIVKLFSTAESNPHGSQLIFASHNTNLLSTGLLRRDQAYLISKTNQGTEAKTIHDLNIRSDASFEKDYLQGEYGAIPNINLGQIPIFDQFGK